MNIVTAIISFGLGILVEILVSHALEKYDACANDGNNEERHHIW